MTGPPVSVVILAGGRSSRFGRDKLSEPIDGRSLLTHVIDAVRPLAAEIIVVVAPEATPDMPGDVRVVHDPTAFEGPLAGAHAGIWAATESIVLVVGGDMPDLAAAVLVSMVASLAGFDVVVLEHDGRPRPLPMVVRRGPAFDRIGALLESGERRLRAVTEAMPALVIAEGTWRALDPGGSTLRDIDVQGDLI